MISHFGKKSCSNLGPRCLIMGRFIVPILLGHSPKNRTLCRWKRIHLPNVVPGKRCYLGIVKWKNKNWGWPIFFSFCREVTESKLRLKSIVSVQKHVWQKLFGEPQFNNIVENWNNFVTSFNNFKNFFNKFSNFGQENSTQNSIQENAEKLAFLGIMGDQLRAPLNLSIRQSAVMYGGFQGTPQLGSYAHREIDPESG